MKKLLGILGIVLLLTACAEEELPVFDTENGQTLAQFSTTSVSLATPEEGASSEVSVTVTTKSASDRMINVAVDPTSTATAGQYNISDLTIPAGSFSGTFTISSSFNALPESGTSNLILILESIGSQETIVENGVLNVDMFRTCPIVLEDFVGTWSGPTSWFDTEGYTTEIETTIVDGELYMNGMIFQWFQGFWGEVIVTNTPVKVDVNLETGEFSISEQPYIISTYDGAPQPAYNLTATGTILNSCDKTLEIFPVLIQGGSPIDGSAYGPLFSETISLN
jgi:hypothetical protein